MSLRTLPIIFFIDEPIRDSVLLDPPSRLPLRVVEGVVGLSPSERAVEQVDIPKLREMLREKCLIGIPETGDRGGDSKNCSM